MTFEDGVCDCNLMFILGLSENSRRIKIGAVAKQHISASSLVRVFLQAPRNERLFSLVCDLESLPFGLRVLDVPFKLVSG